MAHLANTIGLPLQLAGLACLVLYSELERRPNLAISARRVARVAHGLTHLFLVSAISVFAAGQMIRP